VAAALRELDMDFDQTPVVYEVVAGSPADGVFREGDDIVSVQGKQVETPEQVGLAVSRVPEGEPIEFEVLRDGRPEQLSATREVVDDVPRVGIGTRSRFDFPIEVSVAIDPNIGGPSAGLMFSLAIYDTLTEGSMTDGEVIAGTGTITPAGEIGPIGGIDQKIAGARDDEAELFLVPADNCDDAFESPHGDMELVRVADIGEAVAALETWSADRDADLPRCADPGESSE
jgi:Lon-like protease